MCRDAAEDSRGYMIVLDDSDLKKLVGAFPAMHQDNTKALLNVRLDQLVL